MKAREHQSAVAGLEARHRAELAGQKHYYTGELAERDRIIASYERALTEQDARIRELEEALEAAKWAGLKAA